MVVLGASGAPPLLLGDILPIGVILTTGEGLEAGLRIGEHAQVRLDPGAQIRLEEHEGSLGIQIADGRVDISVDGASSPVRVRIRDDAVLFASQAAFGTLAAGGGRWSTAVRAGTVQAAAPRRTLHLAAGQIAGGASDAVSVRSLSERLVLEVNASSSGEGWIVRGLTDLLARVTIDGREVPLDDRGAFSLRFAGPVSRVVTAVDAAGRRTERALAPERAARKPPPSATPVPDSTKKRRGPLRPLPIEW